MTLLSHTEQVARKAYPCDACSLWRDSGLSASDLETDNQRAALAAAEADDWKIPRGAKYVRQAIADNGTVQTWKARSDMHVLISSMDFFDE